MKSLRKQGMIIFIAFALVLSACGGDAAEEEVVVEKKHNVNQALISIGNGGMFGKGFFGLDKLGHTLDKTNIHDNGFHIQAPWDKH